MRVLSIGNNTADIFARACSSIGSELVVRAQGSQIPEVLSQYSKFDTIFVADNQGFEHLGDLAKSTLLLLIDLPGIGDTSLWQALCDSNLTTRITLAKPEMFRLDAVNFGEHARHTDEVLLSAELPYPEFDPLLTFTGDMLSVFCCCELDGYFGVEPINIISDSNTISFDLVVSGKIYHFNIATNAETVSRSIRYLGSNCEIITTLDWPKEECYTNQIKSAFDHINDQSYWQNQYRFDYWLQRTISHLHYVRREAR